MRAGYTHQRDRNRTPDHKALPLPQILYKRDIERPLLVASLKAHLRCLGRLANQEPGGK